MNSTRTRLGFVLWMPLYVLVRLGLELVPPPFDVIALVQAVVDEIATKDPAAPRKVAESWSTPVRARRMRTIFRVALPARYQPARLYRALRRRVEQKIAFS